MGHSQGTMMMFAKLSEDQEFEKKIKMFFALAPVAKLRHVHVMFEALARLVRGSQKIPEMEKMATLGGGLF